MIPPLQKPRESTTSISPAQGKTLVLQLPVEIVKWICVYLPNRELKTLRLTCTFFSATVSLHIDRVFLSANPRNVEVFQAIANHEVFRAQVTEIVWDDALLIERRLGHNPLRGDSDNEIQYDSDDYYVDDYDESPWPRWYRKPCEDNLFDLKDLKGRDVDRSDHVARAQQVAALLPMEEAWAHYQELLQQQREVLKSQAHVRVLELSISSFPALRRITVTCAAHGRLFNPLYETPMIRAFPRGFNYPIPRGWPVTGLTQPECPEWDDSGGNWQGFRAVVRALAQDKDLGRVTELRVDANGLEAGLNSRLFEWPCPALADFEAVLARPGFKHLHLDLMVDPSPLQGDIYRRGLLRRALAGAAAGRGLEHLSFRTNVTLHDMFDSLLWDVPLDTIFPREGDGDDGSSGSGSGSGGLSRLCHFGLSRFYVKQDELLALLAALPPSLRTVELSLLEFTEGSYGGLLRQIRDTLGWRGRDPRPGLTVAVDTHRSIPGRAVWIEKEVDAFLYHGARNPFVGGDGDGDDPEGQPTVAGSASNQVPEGVGVVRDSFEPEHERPNVDIWTLADLGYAKKEGLGWRPRRRGE